jgi:hypothetical protein
MLAPTLLKSLKDELGKHLVPVLALVLTSVKASTVWIENSTNNCLTGLFGRLRREKKPAQYQDKINIQKMTANYYTCL